MHVLQPWTRVVQAETTQNIGNVTEVNSFSVFCLRKENILTRFSGSLIVKALLVSLMWNEMV